MNDDLPEVSVSPARKAFFSGASVVWIIPIAALFVALFVAWQSYNDRGPIITIEFETGAGIKSGETELRYRDVTVGVVEKVSFSSGLNRVQAHVRVDKAVAPFIDNGAVFWIVQPEVSARGITGLSTVLSGVYIEGSWDDQLGPAPESFTGASEAPLIRPGQGGLEIAFRTVANSQLTDNAPILYKGIEVGRIGRARISPRGNFAIVEALIFEDHRSLINQSTRFWDASGFSVSIGTAGAEIDFSSLATLIGGGITFDTFVSGGGRVSDGTVFEVFPDRETARNSVFNSSEVEPLGVSVIFDENISGLTVGAPVELSGLKIGEVESLSGIVNYDQFGDSRVRLNVVLSIQPARLGLPDEVTGEAALAFLQNRVVAGLRARLASASLLTGGLKVELVMVEDSPPARLVGEVGDLPVLPTTQNETSDASATVEGVFTRINNLPIEELLNSAITFMDSAERLVSSEDIRATPGDLRALLGEVQDLVASDDVRNIPVSLNATLTRVEALVTELEKERVATKLAEVLTSAASAVSVVETSVAGVPALLSQIEAVAAKVETLELNELVSEVTSLVRTAEAMVDSEGVQALPGAVKQTLDEVNVTLSEGRLLLGEVQGLVASEDVQNIPVTLNATLMRVEELVTQLEQERITTKISQVLDSALGAAKTVEDSVAGVPALITQIEAVVAKAESLEVDALIDELTGLAKAAEAVVGAEDAKALPGSLKRALDEVNYTLQELREGGAIENVNQTLVSARNAADSVAVSAKDLPKIVERLTALFNRAGRTIDGYNKGDQLSREAQTTMRDIQKAADALASLARTIERNPNSLLLGR
ncbi:intermembrane transport protein PqiB [Sulfitobacter pacificus]|uniref:Paraquat-inducible protein B n=1 Tax=Sulfitobacter pacificus TaxID=1499314 RepID=A0ABQ5VMM8_9RHOB|nr:MlaD family protein [Sulfitobacter pacificus]GLQ28398.1 paraquat-inducible protein B [Sulfitobacter pacificus]